MPLAVGTKAPEFVLKTFSKEGLRDVSLASFKGRRNVVLLFFPFAFTDVCRREMCELSAGFAAYEALDAEVFGISGDSPFAQQAWAEKEHITIPLLSDMQRTAARDYQVLLPDLMGLGPVNARAAFVVGKDGVIRHGEQTPAPTELPDFDAVRTALKGLA